MEAKYTRGVDPKNSYCDVVLSHDDLESVPDLVNAGYVNVRLRRIDATSRWHMTAECMEDGKLLYRAGSAYDSAASDVADRLSLNEVADKACQAWLDENPNYPTIETLVDDVNVYIDEVILPSMSNEVADNFDIDYGETIEAFADRKANSIYDEDYVAEVLADRGTEVYSMSYVYGDDDRASWFEKARKSDPDYANYCESADNVDDALNTLFLRVASESKREHVSFLTDMIYEAAVDMRDARDDLDALHRDYDRTRGTL